eukprot:SAG11_NODE_5750_length_1472_cov_1.654042_1_plen_301_part_10
MVQREQQLRDEWRKQYGTAHHPSSRSNAGASLLPQSGTRYFNSLSERSVGRTVQRAPTPSIPPSLCLQLPLPAARYFNHHSTTPAWAVVHGVGSTERRDHLGNAGWAEPQAPTSPRLSSSVRPASTPKISPHRHLRSSCWGADTRGAGVCRDVAWERPMGRRRLPYTAEPPLAASTFSRPSFLPRPCRTPRASHATPAAGTRRSARNVITTSYQAQFMVPRGPFSLLRRNRLRRQGRRLGSAFSASSRSDWIGRDCNGQQGEGEVELARGFSAIERYGRSATPLPTAAPPLALRAHTIRLE